MRPKQHGGKKSKSPAQAIINDDMKADAYAALLQASFSALATNCKPGAVIYVAHADMWRITDEEAARKAGWSIRQNLIWVKSGWTLGMQDYQWQHEPGAVWLAARGGASLAGRLSQIHR